MDPIALQAAFRVAILILPFVGVTSMVLLCMATAICNEETAPEYRGRVMALFSVAFLGSTPIGGPLIGWISEAMGPRVGLAVGAAASLGTAAWAYGQRRHREPVDVVADPTAVAEPRAA